MREFRYKGELFGFFKYWFEIEFNNMYIGVEISFKLSGERG